MHGFLAGTFDSFHVGHQYVLAQAAARCTRLSVVVAHSDTVKRLKGKAPVNSNEARVERVKQELGHYGLTAEVELGVVNPDYAETLRRIRPERVFIGYDQHIDEAWVGSVLPEAVCCRIDPYAPGYFKSSHFRTRSGMMRGDEAGAGTHPEERMEGGL